MSIDANSKIFFPSILKLSASLLSLAPPHSGHTRVTANWSAHFCSAAVRSVCCCSERTYLTTPSYSMNTASASLFMPVICTLMRSSLPLSNSSITSLVISDIGVSRVKSYLLSRAVICLNISVFLKGPRGAIAPCRTDSERSGKTFSSSTADMYPRPLHLGQNPCGELKEKLCGAGSWYERPVTGHIRRLL